MKKCIVIGFISLFVSATVHAQAVKNTGPLKSIETCAQLLPEGHKFKFNLSGDIDTNDKSKIFKGNLSLSDDTKKENLSLSKFVQPFIDCIKPLLR